MDALDAAGLQAIRGRTENRRRVRIADVAVRRWDAGPPSRFAIEIEIDGKMPLDVPIIELAGTLADDLAHLPHDRAALLGLVEEMADVLDQWRLTLETYEEKWGCHNWDAPTLTRQMLRRLGKEP